jgi:hypothetical protein
VPWGGCCSKNATAVIIYDCDDDDKRAKLAKRINIQPKESRALHVTLHATEVLNSYKESRQLKLA